MAAVMVWVLRFTSDRLLSEDELRDYSQCLNYTATPPGNLVNSDTVWEVSGRLIHTVTIDEHEVDCVNRTLLVPIRYRTMEDAMRICESIGERGNFLRAFLDYTDYVKFYNLTLANPAMRRYCAHGGRYMLWLPYRGWADITDPAVNVTYYKSGQPLTMTDAWRKNNPKSSERPYCVISRMGGYSELLVWHYMVPQATLLTRAGWTTAATPGTACTAGTAPPAPPAPCPTPSERISTSRCGASVTGGTRVAPVRTSQHLHTA